MDQLKDRRPIPKDSLSPIQAHHTKPSPASQTNPIQPFRHTLLPSITKSGSCTVPGPMGALTSTTGASSNPSPPSSKKSNPAGLLTTGRLSFCTSTLVVAWIAVVGKFPRLIVMAVRMRVRRLGSIISKIGRRSGQQVRIMAVEGCARAQRTVGTAL
ncbi:hypothetical protein GQ43DRAFT_39185 [Delitschia confertaspora ATCC 74209]|uniref:Uncharacterized protein n=1 Tax=Delitschia confertaspora ATCC 74209 TaxID=1513339 RepID=A0A9P4JL38_9PLEO|nr:hypothetical protein GQ43DRAFT_39185 [Delitschia confertaspora ATCC 74209]